MKCSAGEGSSRDLVRGWSAFVLWCIPTLLVLVGALVPPVRAVLWVPSFAIMGVACLVNARGCGRLHCFVTGPLFLLAGLATAFDPFAIMSASTGSSSSRSYATRIGARSTAATARAPLLTSCT